MSASQIRGVAGERFAIISALMRMSFRVQIPRSAWPWTEAAVPAPVLRGVRLCLVIYEGLLTMYRASNPAARARRAERPSYTPGAITKPLGSARVWRRLVAAEARGMMTFIDIDNDTN